MSKTDNLQGSIIGFERVKDLNLVAKTADSKPFTNQLTFENGITSFKFVLCSVGYGYVKN